MNQHMLRIFAEVNGTAGFREPEPTSLVIHLRLGDMVDTAAADVQTMLISGADPGSSAVRNYPNSIKSVPELLADAAVANVTTVHIVGGGCWRFKRTKGDCIKSTIYAQCVLRAFEHQGYTTTLSMDGENADEDFYFMAHAKHFIETAGGFSRLASNLVERQGGTVYGRRFELNIGVPAKWKAPDRQKIPNSDELAHTVHKFGTEPADGQEAFEEEQHGEPDV